MSQQLEIFQDASVYTSEATPENDMISVPLDLQDISTFVRNTNQIIPVQSQLVLSGLLDTTNMVNVLDKYGSNVKGNLVSINNEVVVTAEGRTIVVKKPVLIQTIAQGKLYQVDSSGNPVVLKGVNTKVSWSPIYHLHINEREELTNMNLSAFIQNSGERFDVNRMILSLKNYYGAAVAPQPQYRRARSRGVPESMGYSSAQVMAAAPMPDQTAEELPRSADESKTYLVERLVRLTKEVNMPLWNRQVTLPRIYFFFIGDTKVYYGYEISDIGNEFFPSGKVRVFNTDMTAIKEFDTTGSLKKKVRFLVDESVDVRLTPNVQSNEQGVTEFTLVVNSNKKNPIHLKIIQKVRNYKRIISEHKYTEDRNWGEICWDTQINPGINEIKGAFTIVYS